MSRYFRIEQARGLLGEVERLLRRAVREKSVFAEAESKWQAFQRKIYLMGGVAVETGRISDLKSTREQSLTSLKAAVDEIAELGVQVKDLDTGLVDFPTLYRGEEVLLCWRLGENDIAYWHNLTDGFRGRQPIDKDFLDNHTGDPTQ